MQNKLTSRIEEALGKSLKTPKDFDYLRDRIFQRLGELVSSTTLKRVWGYLGEDVTPRENTMNVLSRFIGYNDWADFCARAVAEGESESNPLMSRRLSVREELKPGDRVALTWLPDRRCETEYLGDGVFFVTEAVNTRLCAGDTFVCSLMIEDEPLYLDRVSCGGKEPVAYVCGKKSGIKFEKLK